jgi:D-sedoheptulose 7-phosphate isomerase
MAERAEDVLRAAAEVHERLAEHAGEQIERVAERLVEVLQAGGTVYVMGNGGSAADAQHLAGELVGRFLMERRPLPCVALSTDSSILTAVGNDYGFDNVFARQVAALVRPGDAVIGVSTSGSSVNVNAAIDEARERGAVTVALSGGDGGLMAQKCDLAIVVPAKVTPRIQEAHATIIHILCGLIEQAMFGNRQ